MGLTGPCIDRRVCCNFGFGGNEGARGGLSWANLFVFQPPEVGAPVARAGARLHL